MAWRFKASKYKNAAPIVPKPEQCVRDIIVGSYQTYGNNIAASAAFMAFIWEHTGSNLAVLPLDDCGRKPKTMPLLHAHSDTTTDLAFSPFHDGLLATSSQDCSVKVWSIPENGLEQSLSNPECVFNHRQKRVETVTFHPTADCLLSSTASGCISLYDLTNQTQFFNDDSHPDVIQSLSWKQDGTILATSCKDKCVRIIDPRNSSPIVQTADSHQSIKDSRVVWLGSQNRILTTGFDACRMRQVMIRDLRNFDTPEKILELDSSTGILIPLFDSDTNMLFLAGKGDITIAYQEVTEKEPFLVEGLRHTGEQTKGACLIPKRAVTVMEGEVNRLLQLTSNSVVPITYQVPRKSYRDFHHDLYPDTYDYKTELLPDQWQKGKDVTLNKISLDPAKRELGEKPIVILRGNLQHLVNTINDNTKNLKTAINNNTQNQTVKTKIIENIRPKSEDQLSEFEAKYKTIKEKVTNKEIAKVQANNERNNENGKMKSHSGTTNGTNNNNNSVVDGPEMVPPKPAPRTSISDQGSFDESSGIYPKPKPRSSITNFKPRLGPKPYSSDSTNESFDKVFAVPQAPGQEIAEKKVEVEITKDENQEEEVEEQPNEEVPEDPEIKPEETSPEVEEEPDNETQDEQKTSIAERRRMYEHRSKSCVEEKQKSSHIIRHDSMKTKDEMQEKVSKPEMKNGKDGVDHKKTNASSKRTSTVFGKVSKYRHLKGTTAHKSSHIENIKNISRQLPGECDVFHGNYERAAVPIAGAGGKIAVFELSKPGRLPDGVIPSFVNGTNIMDFQWDPFKTNRLAVACDDGSIKLWDVPSGGLTEPINVPSSQIFAHADKMYFIKYHPLAEDVLVSASYDLTIKIWDVATGEEKYCLEGHKDQIFDLCWSGCGNYCATVCKDGKLRVYEPRKQSTPIKEGNGGPIGSRGARITYTIGGKFLCVTGFDKVSERQIYLFKLSNLDQHIGMVGLDVSPAILIPFYDEDSSTLFVTGKGDSTIYAYEVTEDAPYLCPLSHHRCPSLHQGLSFFKKNQCDVTIVEFAKCLRLTNNTIEMISFTVPRLKTDYFQDDLFPPTKVLWSPLYSSKEWFANASKNVVHVSLQPNDMLPLSSLNQNNQVQGNRKDENSCKDGFNSLSVKHKQDEIKNSVSSRVKFTTKLEQDDMEGVEEKEWEEDE